MPITVTTRSRDRSLTRRPYSLYDVPNPNMEFVSNYNTKLPRNLPRPPSYIEFMASRLASMGHPVTKEPKISPDLETQNAFSSGGYLSENGQKGVQYSNLDTRNTILDSAEQNLDSGDQCPNCPMNSRNDKEPSRSSGFGDRRDSKGSSEGASTSEVSSSEGSCDLAKSEGEAHPPALSECASSSSSFLYGKEETAQVKEGTPQVEDLEKLQEDLGCRAKEKGKGDSTCWLSTLLQHYKSMLIWSSKKSIKSPAKSQTPDTAPGEPNPGIYVKKVIEGTPAHEDGRLHTGDQLLSVNNKSLVGISQEQAAQQMVSAGSEIHFEVAKQMAMINGLDTWLARSMNEKNVNPSIQMAKGQKSSQHPSGLPVNDFGGQRVHGRSISASELYSQADTASLTSAGSAQPPPNVPPHQYAQPHQYQSQGRLPSHYKPTQRSAACVVQPGRPAASPINSRRNGNASPTSLLTTIGNGQQVTSCGNMPQRFRPAQQLRSASTVPFGSHYANPNHRMSFESAAELANLQRQREAVSLLTDYSKLPLISQNSNNIGNNNIGSQSMQAPLAGMETESLNSSGSGNSGGVPTQNLGLSDQASTHLIGVGTPTSSNSSSARSSGSQKYTKQQPLSLDLRLYQTKFNDQGSIINGNNGVHPGSGIHNLGQALPAYSNSSSSTSPLPPPPAVSSYFNGGSDWSRPGVKPLDTDNGQFRNNTHRNGAGGSQRQRLFTPASTSQLPIGQVRVFQHPAPGSQQPKQFPVSGRRSAPLFGQEDPLREVEQQASRAMTTDELNEELDRLDSKEVVTEADKQHYRKLLQELAERNGQESLGASKSSSDFRRAGMKSSRQTVSTSALDPDHNHVHQPTQPLMMMGRSNNGVALPYIGEMEFKLNRRAAQNPEFSSAPLKGHHLQQNSAENEIDDVSRVANRLNNMAIDEEAEENGEAAQSNVIKSTLVYGQTAPKATVEKAPVSAMRDSSSPEDKAKKRVQFRDLDNLETDENVDSNRNGHHHIRLPSMEEEEETLDKDHTKNGNIGDESEQEPRVQIIGTNEVYKDPRQRRLDQQHQAKALRPVVDGSNLGFRDKMKLFATQLGEQTPKNKLKNSSVERDIEHQINNGNNPGP
ncbi:PDZ domain (Also known as DHR or GLGF) domain-containing protein [Ditylenchus destructor]|uniref:PDZ domain (Also known as DHR or GLGF) domain-containing protein n=1 Tax=Ditylenchus destructor TaxID=166010 RepID=A0AAD4MSV5_9BILA|nr:PDZ domain (Also known as DHR or GLGF) domain-containing protein [Ditylenchus destructor]